MTAIKTLGMAFSASILASLTPVQATNLFFSDRLNSGAAQVSPGPDSPSGEITFIDGNATWGEGVPRIDPGLSPAFTQRFALNYRRPVSDSLSVLSSTALGMKRADGLFNNRTGRHNPEPDSLFVMSGGAEFALTSILFLGCKTEISREMPWTGRELAHWDSGITLTLAATDDTWLSAGAFIRRDIGVRGLSRVFTASMGSRLFQSPLTLNVNGWTVSSQAASGWQNAAVSSAVDASLAWQVSDSFWSCVGYSWNTDNMDEFAWTRWSAYAKFVLQVSEVVSFGLDLCYSRYAGKTTLQDAMEQNETRVRLSRCTQVNRNFSTEISMEYPIGGQSGLRGNAPPAVWLLGQITF